MAVVDVISLRITGLEKRDFKELGCVFEFQVPCLKCMH